MYVHTSIAFHIQGYVLKSTLKLMQHQIIRYFGKIIRIEMPLNDKKLSSNFNINFVSSFVGIVIDFLSGSGLLQENFVPGDNVFLGNFLGNFLGK